MSTRTIPARGVLASEWTKVRSVRSTYLTLLGAAAGAIVIGLLATHSAVTGRPDPHDSGFEAVSVSLLGFAIVQLAFGALGVLVISSEHGTGTIMTTFAAVPRRRAVLAAKAVVAGALTVAVGEVLAFVTFFLGQLILSRRHLDVTLADPHVLRAVASAGLYLGVVALTGLSLGAIIRHTAGAIATVFGLVFILPQLVNALPTPWNVDIGDWTLDHAIQSLINLRPRPDLPTTGTAYLALLAWTVIPLAAALLLITRRDT